ncbi:efflux transporter outer membrane subunit [Sulfuriferula nivalis]|uniref:RND transporter n=1 Tax=Sulfuriferula nivalis TaxID=2675298 RepID=A0A809S1H4_9PROT|nr:efflux transporter outer membrane subunit [Sulfuriferula nivalis]BBP00418.1 RND transporter [Sulfuriferula nivalis]
MNLDQHLIKLPLVTALLLTLAGCADFSGIAPQSKLLTPHALSASNQADATVFPQQHWWQAYGDTQLDDLIAQAIAHNPSLKIAQSRMLQAQAAASVADSALYPQVNAAAQSTRERLSANSIYPPPLGGSTVWMNSATVSASWQFDWFGKQHAALEAALGQVRAAQADTQAAQVVLAANVAQQYFSLARLQAQQQITKRMLQHGEQHEQLISQRAAAGLDNALVQHQSQAQVTQIQRDLAALDEQVAIARHALAVLTGAEPDATAQLTARLPLNIQADVPHAIPAELLGHRADVVAARWRVESELQSVHEAKAAFYPNINLTAFVGLEAIGLSQWLAADSRTLGAGPAISLPIFDAGRLRAQLQGRTAQTDVAIESYNTTVLNALREVADKLASGQALQTQLQAQTNTMTQLNAAYDLALARYRGGLSNYLVVLDADNAVLQQHSALIDLLARACDVHAGLMLALGGGYIEPQQSNKSADDKIAKVLK